MEEKIFQCLKQTYSAKYGVGDEILRGHARGLAATGLVTDENIATVIQGQENALRTIQSNFDRVRKEGSDCKKELDELRAKYPEKKETAEAEEKKDEIPSWAQCLIDSNKAVSERLSVFEQKTSAEKRNADILAKAKEYDIPESFTLKFNIPEGTNLDDYMKGVKQDFVNIGFGENKQPDAGSGVAGNGSDIANLINSGTKEIIEQTKK